MDWVRLTVGREMLPVLLHVMPSEGVEDIIADAAESARGAEITIDFDEGCHDLTELAERLGTRHPWIALTETSGEYAGHWMVAFDGERKSEELQANMAGNLLVPFEVTDAGGIVPDSASYLAAQVHARIQAAALKEISAAHAERERK